MTLLFQNLCFIRPFGFLSKSSSALLDLVHYSAIFFGGFGIQEGKECCLFQKHQLFLFGFGDLKDETLQLKWKSPSV
jgi:hypothetical protein